MVGWELLLQLVTLITAAFLVGTLFEKLRIGAVVGYLLAGVLVGPGALGWVTDQDAVSGLAELGIALVLFTTGLEFSLLRLRKMGHGTFFAGAAQLLVCMVLFTGIALAFGLDPRTAIALSAVFSVSSTVIVLRILRDRFELDAPHGKIAFGILIVQDIALVPLVLLVTLLGRGPEAKFDVSRLVPAVGVFLVAAVVFILVVTRVLPRVFRSRAMATNRELPILLAIVTCTGAAWGAHSFGISASVGAFLAGVLLAETSFEEQIRADMASFRAVFGTIFFVSIGMLADLGWIVGHIPLVLGVAVLLIVGKTLANFVAIRAYKRVTISSAAAALTLAQVGELGFILLQSAKAGGLVEPGLAHAVTAAIVLSMIVAPLLISRAPRLARGFAQRVISPRKLVVEGRKDEAESLHGHFVIVGFGTAGRTATRILGEGQYPVVVVDIDPKFPSAARDLGGIPRVGDATQVDILEELNLNDALAMIVAIPDARTSSLLIANARRLAPDLPIVARCRYHSFLEELRSSGANLVLGEEELLGRRLGLEATRLAVGQTDEDVLRAD